MVTVVSEVTLGAVNSPLLLIVPAVVDQVTAVFEAFFTCTVNCWVLPEVTVAVDGDTLTLMGPAFVWNVLSNPVTRTPDKSSFNGRKWYDVLAVRLVSVTM